MKIDNRPVPDAVIDAICRLVDRLDSEKIIATSRGVPALFQGYRATVQTVPVARQRIKDSLRSNRPIDPVIMTLLRSVGLSVEVVIVLSEEALKEAFSDLAQFFGTTDFLAATLLDKRESVRKIAHDYIAEWDGQGTNDLLRGKATENIRNTFSSFLSNIKGLLTDALPPPLNSEKKDERTEKNRRDKALEATQSEVARLTKSVEREQKERKELQETISLLRRELVDAREETKSRETTLSALQNAYAELQNSLQERIDIGVSSAMSDKLRKWLEPVRNVEDALTSAQQSDLMGRTAELLKKQRLVDLKYGNRAALTKMLEERREILADVQRAQIDALNPLPELVAIAADLEVEIGDISRRLGEPDEHIASTVLGLLARINATRSLDDLSEMRQFVQEATKLDLFHGHELHQLYCATTNKAGLLYDQAEILGKDRLRSPEKRFFLGHAVAQKQCFILYIDGHNVLYALNEAFDKYYEDGHPRAKARVEFGNRLTRFFSDTGADVRLYFDGDHPTQQSLSNQVRVYYSGGKGANRADEAILKDLSFCIQSKASAPLCLVTRDGDLARQAIEMGAIIMHPEEFAISLDLASN